MAMKIQPPNFQRSKTYERYKQELQAWRQVTEIDPKKQAIAIALTLPEDDSTGIREKVFDELTPDEMGGDKGLDKLIEFLDAKLAKDDLADSLEKFEDFEDFNRTKGQSVTDYISKFDQKYNRLVKLRITLPQEILAFKLLRRANITKEEKLLVLTGMDYSMKATLYDQAKKSLKKFKGDQAVGGDSKNIAIKLEPAYLAEHEEALMAAGYIHQSRAQWNPRGRGIPGRGRGRWRGAGPRGPIQDRTRGRPVNPTGQDGRVARCFACGSYRHMLANCPESWENQAKVNCVKDDAQLTSEIDEKCVLFTGSIKENMVMLGTEARNCAILDSACSSTVCGETWMKCYIDSLDEHDRMKVLCDTGKKTFKFGGGERLKSVASYNIPAILAGQEVTIKTDVVKSDIPLLLSSTAMKNARVKLDLENDVAEILGKKVALNHTSSGHYSVCIDKHEETPLETVCAVKLDELKPSEQHKVLLKLHRQFAHPPEGKLIALMKDAGIWEEQYETVLKTIYEECQLCKMYGRTPPRPVVALPMAKRFNEKVAMDLKKWHDRWILHLVDMWSRFTVSVFVRRKRTSEIIDKIMMHWVGAAFGVMGAIMSDNGGEFSSDEMREVASILNVGVFTTAAESPFQNGLCERIHAVTDMMLLKMEEQCPNVPIEVLLCWANMARNSLQMWCGFSSYQLVFGQNPNLPNIMSSQLPALEGSTTSEVLAKHMNALHAARRAFVESEAGERIRRALRSKIRASEQVFSNGDLVYYKRDGIEKWLGPGKVVFQDGKVIFVRHGGVFVRVSPNRLVKAGTEFANTKDITSQPKYELRGDDFQDDCGKVTEIIGVAREQETWADSSGVAMQSENKDEVRFAPQEKVQYKLAGTQDWTTAEIIGRAGKSTGKNRNWYNVKDINGETKSVDFAKVLWRKWEKEKCEDVNVVMIPKRCHKETDCVEAKRVELNKLKDFSTYEEVQDCGQDRISTTWVLWKKGTETRARLVARGFEEDTDIRKDSPTIGKNALKVFLALAASNNWTVQTTDIKSAFLQGKRLDRDVYLTPPCEAEVPDGTIWKLVHCLYGLNDAARHFFQSVVEVLNSVDCRQSFYDPALFYYKKNEHVIGLLASHVDDFLHAGEIDFDESVMKKLRGRFLAGKLERGFFSYVGFSVNQCEGGAIVLNQKEYVEDLEAVLVPPQRASQKLEPLSAKEHTQLRSMVGKLNWAVQGTRPDLCFEMVELSTKFKQGTVTDLIRASKCIRKMKDQEAKIVFPKLGNIQKWKLIVYSDASHANLCDGVGSVGAHIVLLVGEESRCCPLAWQAGKLKRVVRSTIAAETLSLQQALENGYYLRGMIEELVGVPKHSIPLEGYVDNRSVVEALHSTKMVDDKRLRLDLGAIKQSLNAGEVNAVKWCPGSLQLANVMTKRGASGLQLLEVIQSGKVELPG